MSKEMTLVYHICTDIFLSYSLWLYNVPPTIGELTVVLRPEQYARNDRYKSIIRDTLNLLLEEVNNTGHGYIPDNAN